MGKSIHDELLSYHFSGNLNSILAKTLEKSWRIKQYWLPRKKRVILIPYWSKIDPKIDPGDIILLQAWVFAFSWMTSWALLQIHFSGWERKLHGKNNIQHATKPWYYKAVRILLFQYSKSQSQMEGWAVLRWSINDVQHFNCAKCLSLENKMNGGEICHF